MDFPGFRDKYADFGFLDKLPGDVSDDDDVVSCCGSFFPIEITTKKNTHLLVNDLFAEEYDQKCYLVVDIWLDSQSL